MSKVSVVKRVIHFEIRKLVNTRSAKLTLLSILSTGVLGALGTAITTHALDRTFSLDDATGFASVGLFLGIPFLGVLGMTSDWSFRTSTTYTPLVQSRTLLYACRVAGILIASMVILTVVIASSSIVWGVAALLNLQETTVGVSFGSLLNLYASVGLFSGFAMGVSAIARRPIASIATNFAFTIGSATLFGFLQTSQGSWFPTFLVPATSNLSIFFYTVGEEVVSGASNTETIVGLILGGIIWYVAPLLLGWKIHERAQL